MKIVYLLIIFFSPVFVLAQAIDNTAIFRTINADNYVRFHYENDFFTATDQYYTQGLNLEMVNPGIKQSPLTKLLYKPAYSHVKYGVAIEHNAYTPTSIRHNEIIVGDRPFAASFFLKTFLIATDSASQQRAVSAFSFGVLGPGAGGREMQQDIHQWLNNIQPLGWAHQIKNDVVINYEMNYERGLYHKSFFLISANGGARLGTLSDKTYGSVSAMLGRFDNPFHYPSQCKRKWQLYVYAQPAINIVGYDATLQGGVFTSTSEYTISAGNLKRVTLQQSIGFAIKIKGFYLEYFKTFLTREFETGHADAWGGLRVGVYF